MHSRDVKDAGIRVLNEIQLNWHAIFPALPNGKFYIDKLISIQGDAPKDFIRIRRHVDRLTSGKNGRRRRITRRRNRWPGYIAKVGSKFYPIESITEHLLTRIGQLHDITMAESHLRMVGNQVRFLSLNFLKPHESLIHGIDMFKSILDSELVEEIAETRSEQKFYTFKTVCDAVEEKFPKDSINIIRGFVEMLTFDALVGNNDRHHANWGVIAPARGDKPARFSPVFDTARALFWNVNEKRILQIQGNEQAFSSYVRKTDPQVGWEGCDGIGHFELIRKIYETYPAYRPQIEKHVNVNRSAECSEMIDREFFRIMSDQRRKLIVRCLNHRQQLLRLAVN